jgi:hypothetical protein
MTKQELREQIEAKLDKHDDWTYWCAIGDDSKPEEYSGIELLDDLMTLFDQALIEARVQELKWVLSVVWGHEGRHNRDDPPSEVLDRLRELTKPERSDV